jgi:multidrug efflux pump subunit AcrA (membrane-fusion protein)
MSFSKLIILLILVVSIVGCQSKLDKARLEESIPVKVDKVQLQELYETLDYTGDIKAKDEAIIYPKVSGKIIEKVKQDGNSINKGEAICFIDRDEVGLKFEKAPVESTLTGIVGRVYVDIGENVTAQTSIALVVSMDKVKIDLDIPERYLPKVNIDQEAIITVDAYPSVEFKGVVTKISPVVDLSTRTAPIEITLDNFDHQLKSGMFAKVRLALEVRRSVPVILKEAVLGRSPDNYVFVAEGKKAVAKKVKLGIRQGSYYEVQEGLKEGDSVVIVGQQILFDGARVEPEVEE